MLSTSLAIIDNNTVWYNCVELEAQLNGVMLGRRCKILEVSTFNTMASKPLDLQRKGRKKLHIMVRSEPRFLIWGWNWSNVELLLFDAIKITPYDCSICKWLYDPFSGSTVLILGVVSPSLSCLYATKSEHIIRLYLASLQVFYILCWTEQFCLGNSTDQIIKVHSRNRHWYNSHAWNQIIQAKTLTCFQQQSNINIHRSTSFLSRGWWQSRVFSILKLLTLTPKKAMSALTFHQDWLIAEEWCAVTWRSLSGVQRRHVECSLSAANKMLTILH